MATQLLPPSLLLLVFSACIEGGAGSDLEFLENIMFNSSAIVIPLGNVKKTILSKSERDNTKLSVESKEGQALIGILLGDG